MNVIGNVAITEGILDDLRNFFGSAIHFSDVPAHEFNCEDHVIWAYNPQMPEPDLKIGDHWQDEVWRYDFFLFRCYIFFNKFSTTDSPSIFLMPPSHDRSPESWIPLFSEVFDTKDVVLLAEKLAEYGIDGIHALSDARTDDVDVAIWVNYHFDPDWIYYHDKDSRYKFGFLLDENHIKLGIYDPFNPRYFATYGEAKKFVKDYLSSHYQLRPYELARPTYTIVDTTREIDFNKI